MYLFVCYHNKELSLKGNVMFDYITLCCLSLEGLEMLVVYSPFCITMKQLNTFFHPSILPTVIMNWTSHAYVTHKTAM